MSQTRMGSPQKGNPGRIQPLDFIHKVLGSFLSSRRAARKSFLPFPRNRAGRNVVSPLPFGIKGPPIGDALGPICVEHRTAPVDQPTVSIQPDDIDIAGKHGYPPSRRWRLPIIGYSKRSWISKHLDYARVPVSMVRTSFENCFGIIEVLALSFAVNPKASTSVEVLAQAALKPAIDFTSRYSSRPNFPHSRPLPDCL